MQSAKCRCKRRLLRVHLTVLGAQRWPQSRAIYASYEQFSRNGQLKSAVWRRSCSFQYRPHDLLELGPGCGRCHLPYQAYTPGNSPELFTVASGDTDRSVYQLVAQDRGHLHRQQAF